METDYIHTCYHKNKRKKKKNEVNVVTHHGTYILIYRYLTNAWGWVGLQGRGVAIHEVGCVILGWFMGWWGGGRLWEELEGGRILLPGRLAASLHTEKGGVCMYVCMYWACENSVNSHVHTIAKWPHLLDACSVTAQQPSTEDCSTARWSSSYQLLVPSVHAVSYCNVHKTTLKATTVTENLRKVQ